MTVSKSILESVELENGQTFYIQYSSTSRKQATISFDGPVMSFNISMDAEEVDQIIDALKKAKGEADAN